MGERLAAARGGGRGLEGTEESRRGSIGVWGVVDYTWRFRRGGREAEGGGLLNRYTDLNLYRGFESPSLRFGLGE